VDLGLEIFAFSKLKPSRLRHHLKDRGAKNCTWRGSPKYTRLFDPRLLCIGEGIAIRALCTRSNGDYKYVGTTNSKPPGQIIMIGQSKKWSSSQIIFITLFSSRCITFAAVFTCLSNLSTYAAEKPIS